MSVWKWDHVSRRFYGMENWCYSTSTSCWSQLVLASCPISVRKRCHVRGILENSYFLNLRGIQQILGINKALSSLPTHRKQTAKNLSKKRISNSRLFFSSGRKKTWTILLGIAGFWSSCDLILKLFIGYFLPFSLLLKYLCFIWYFGAEFQALRYTSWPYAKIFVILTSHEF